MKRQDSKKKMTARSRHAFEARIVELSLQNPDFGARRLVSLLKQERIRVSASQIYKILKRHGLQTSEKRLAKLAKQSRKKPARAAKKKPAKPARITEELAERIVQVSLQHPDYGARRLVPLLEKDGIQLTASAVYRILKCNDLQNRQKRLAKINKQQAVEALRPKAEKLRPVSQVQAEKVPPSPIPSVSRAYAKTRTRRSWALTLFNLVLLVLLAYLALHAVQNVRSAMQEPQVVASSALQSINFAEDATKIAAAARLNDYRTIWQRNLFNISKQEPPAPEKEIAVEKLALAREDLGLKLVGTAVADDPMLRRAFIDNRSTRKQEAYREGDTAGGARIKKILRNKVVIATKDGDRLLTVEIETTGKGKTTSTAAPQMPGSSTLKSQSAGSKSYGGRTRSVSLDRQEVEASLADIDQLLAELDISPYTRFQKPAGFRIRNISSDSILSKMGLSGRDAIVAINDQKITSPDQAAEFFSMIAEAGEVTIRARRRLRTRRINLSIE